MEKNSPDNVVKEQPHADDKPTTSDSKINDTATTTPKNTEDSKDENPLKSESKKIATESHSTSNPLPGIYNKFVASFESAINELIHSPERKKECHLSSFDIEGIANFIKEESPTNIIFMVGAGISTSAGIPDFRTPGTGLYDNLQKYKLPHPHAIFEISYFKKHPEPFFALAKELFQEKIKPTPAHFFIRLFEEKKILRRCYTQNIDMLEFESGMSEDKIITAHGSHHTSTCLSCKKKYDYHWMNDKIRQKESEVLVPKCEKLGCKGTVKPDIVFFGENLPARFFASIIEDFPKCDLLIIMGTSLVVQPFASLITQVPESTPRILINKTPAGEFELRHQDKDNMRDVYWSGDCNEGVFKLARYLGWETELNELIKKA